MQLIEYFAFDCVEIFRIERMGLHQNNCFVSGIALSRLELLHKHPISGNSIGQRFSWHPFEMVGSILRSGKCVLMTEN